MRRDVARNPMPAGAGRARRVLHAAGQLRLRPGCRLLRLHDVRLPARPEIKSPLVYERIVTAVEAELIGKGLRRETGSPALLVALHGRLSKQTQMDTTSYGYGWGGGGGTTAAGATAGPGRARPPSARCRWACSSSTSWTPGRRSWSGRRPRATPWTRSPRPTRRTARIKEVMKEIFAGFPPASK